MKTQKRIAKQRQRRQFRVRNRIRRSVSVRGRPRLSVFRSNKHIYAQIIDDKAGRTLVAACTLEKNVSGSGQSAGNRESAVKVGRLLAERALEQGIKEVVLDRGRNMYHGRVAALADAAREGGLQF
ncbi:MAG: 50S ribosomal protein L18 [Planctomycetes bacterium]|nr:50S ribosomal protein L18 [Planctomycetota bacterium]